MTFSTSQYAVIALVIVIVIVTLARFELLCFRDLAQHTDYQLRYLSRTGWAVVIAVVIPIGGIAYLRFGRSV